MFVRQMRSLVVFLQGHLEYESDTLAREYRRDLSRLLGGEFAASPNMPQGYFSAEAERALELFRDQARAAGRRDAVAAYPDVALRGLADLPWRRSADLLYRNWLGLVAERKTEAVHKASSLAARWGG